MRVVFELASPIVGGEHFFDGLLTTAALFQALGRDALYLDPNIEILDVELPIFSTVMGGHRIWHASMVDLTKARMRTDKIKKRFDEEYLNWCKNKKINIGSGKFKAVNMPYPVYLVDKIEFYAKGDIAEVKQLLSRVKAIGGKRQIGYGRIKSFTVDPMDEDISLSKRRTPAKDISPGYRYGVGRVEPPYFLPTGHTMYKVAL